MNMQKRKVIIVGGGVAGMSAAHELAKYPKHFEVEIYERHEKYCGGKARSIDYDANGCSASLPAEHGFRFFPGFYVNLDATMKQIPIPGSNKNVLNNLVHLKYYSFLFPGGKRVDVPMHLDRKLIWKMLKKIFRRKKNITDAASDNIDSKKENIDITNDGYRYAARCVAQLLTSCRNRVDNEYEALNWLEFVEGYDDTSVGFGSDYQYFVAEGLTRNLVACRADIMSVRTASITLTKMIQEILSINGAADRVLNAPTNEAWLFPWKKLLLKRGVKLHNNAFVTNIFTKPICNSEYIVCGIQVEANNGQQYFTTHVSPDFFPDDKNVLVDENADYLFAVPMEQFQKLISNNKHWYEMQFQKFTDNRKGNKEKIIREKERNYIISEIDTSLQHLDELIHSLDWMNGVVFYLCCDAPVIDGHITFSKSAWAMTAISQNQFWNSYSLPTVNGKYVKTILSVVISDWHTQDENGRTAKSYDNEDELIAAAWAHVVKTEFDVFDENGNIRPIQKDDMLCGYLTETIVKHPQMNQQTGFPELNTDNFGRLSENDLERLRDWTLQRLIEKRRSPLITDEPLLINKIGTWSRRPQSYTRLENLFLASDYIKTETDLATMEAANEAAKRAVNNIIDNRKEELFRQKKYWSAFWLRKVRIRKYRPFFIWYVLTPLKWLDYYRYKWGMDWKDFGLARFFYFLIGFVK
jgi:uncharacterized protein with NAD-binding domain and iron-sulfur cluster